LSWHIRDKKAPGVTAPNLPWDYIGSFGKSLGWCLYFSWKYSFPAKINALA